MFVVKRQTLGQSAALDTFKGCTLKNPALVTFLVTLLTKKLPNVMA